MSILPVQCFWRFCVVGQVLLAIMCGFNLSPLLTSAYAGTPTAAPSSSLGWYDDFDSGNDKLKVVTTVAPISSIVRNIGGTAIDLFGIVPDGVNSHTFEPVPSDAVALAQADLIIVNGLGLEEPTIALAEANLKVGAEIFSLAEDTIAEEEWVFDFSFPDDGGDPNPHLWVNIPYAMRYAELTAAILAERDPANATLYEENLARYLAQLERLNTAISVAVATIPVENRKLLTYHDSFAYFAKTYGFTVIGAVQPSDFSEPAPRDVARLIEQIREEDVPAVFGSEVFPSQVLERIAAEAGAAYIDGLRDDAPPGDPYEPGHSYIGMMLANMELLIPALGGTTEALATIEPFDTYA
ncbi:MAG: metal ABC transporter substrate-binding protein [Chloroflexota bacterium]|nr:metal ABC transporter substrate-binding protein [Chloroflexota bacterium]